MAVGCGWQTFVAYVNVGCYYGVGIPLGSLLGFYFKLGAKVYMLRWSTLMHKNGETYIQPQKFYFLCTGNMVGNARWDVYANTHFDMGHVSNRLE